MTTDLPELTGTQSAALDAFARLKVGAAFMEQGMGKSRVAVEMANSRAHRIDAVLWVAPYSVLPTVQAEAEKWGCRVPIRFLGYQTLSQSDRTYLETLEWAQRRKLMVVADESTFIKNHHSLRNRRLTEIRRHADYALVLNGTPLTRDLWDLKRQMDWLSPRILGTTDREYSYRYFRMHKKIDPGGSERVWFEAYEPNVEHLKGLMRPYIYEARLDVGVPETSLEQTHDVSAESRAAYKAERDAFLEAWEQWSEEIALYRMLGNLKKIAALDPDKCRSTAQAVTGHHTIVFCQYREEQLRIAAHLPEAEYLLISGDTPDRERREIFERFRTEQIPLLITYGTGSYGLNLQHVNTCHFASLPFDYGEIEQARSRIRRLGQERHLIYTTHVSDLGIDAVVARNIQKKGWLADLVRHKIDLVDL